jgi:hypothetical protein
MARMSTIGCRRSANSRVTTGNRDVSLTWVYRDAPVGPVSRDGRWLGNVDTVLRLQSVNREGMSL